MGLGAYRFQLLTAAFQDRTKNTTYRWSAQDRAGRSPALQFLGEGIETMDLQGRILPTFRGGLGQVRAMRAQAKTGEPLMLVDGLGFVYSRWVITQIRETETIFFPNGAPRLIEFSVSLSRYGEDQA
ncbi:MAG: phage tail protein [Pseudomonadota bacterium]